jgi:hypothetical protein
MAIPCTQAGCMYSSTFMTGSKHSCMRETCAGAAVTRSALPIACKAWGHFGHAGPLPHLQLRNHHPSATQTHVQPAQGTHVSLSLSSWC